MRQHLTEKQENFVRAYLSNGRDAPAAYRLAYDAAGMKVGAVNVEACRLVRNPKVARRIGRVLDRVEARTEITVERILKEYARIAFADMRTFTKWNADGITLKDGESLSEDDAAAVQEVSQTITKEGGTLKIKLHDKLGALNSLAKINGQFIERRETTIIDPAASEKEAEARQFMHRMLSDYAKQVQSGPGPAPKVLDEKGKAV